MALLYNQPRMATVAGKEAGSVWRLGRQDFRDLIGRERFLGKEEEGVDLRDGAIDSPAGPHLPPMEDEFLRDG